MTEQKAYQVADWNGESGEYWAANQARLDAMFAVFGQAAIEAAAPAAGERVLDVGCGAGASSLALAARVGAGGHVLGVDISEPLIGRARELAPQDTPVLFQVADASNAELPEGAFDILFSRFGVMFFDDPTGAFAHMRHALRPGGRVAFICWRGVAENDWVQLPMGAIRGIVPLAAPPDPEAPGPFSFGDRGRVTRILTAAGFTDINFAPFDVSIPFGEGETRDAAIDDAVRMAFEGGPLSLLLAHQSDDIRAQASAAIRAAFASLPGERSVMIGGAAWIVMAGKQPHVVGGIRQIHHHPVGILRLLRVEHASADADPHLLAKRALGAEFLRGTHHVGGHRLFDGRQLRQPLAEHATAADLLLWRIWLVQRQATRAAQLPGRLLDHNAELLTKRPRVGLSQVHSRLDTHRIKMEFHLAADAPHFGHVRIA